MELHRLQCFQVVVEEGGFKRATARLNVTQPALSYQIKQLEDELGSQLLYRRPGGVVPTEAGRLLLHHTQLITAAVAQAQRAVKDLADGVVGEIRVGTTNSIGTHFLPEVLWEMRTRHPKARPSLWYCSTPEVIEALLGNQLNLAIVADPTPDRRLHYEKLVEERVSLVCCRGHPLYGKSRVEAADLRGVQFVSLSPDTPTGAHIRDYLDRLGISVEPVVSTDNVETVKRMVEAGMGVAFLPDMVTCEDVACDAQPDGRLSRAELVPPLTRKVTLVTWRDMQPSRAVSAFMAEVRRVARNWKGCRES